MQRFLVKDIVEACGGTLISGDDTAPVTGVTADSREVKEGYLFIPFKGERSNGHDFLEKAFSFGAAVALTEEDREVSGGTLIRVDSTLDALGKIAAAYLKKYRVPVVGVTGSVGKTSTKDIISAVLAKKYNILKSTGNHNNEIGMPLTILGMEEDNDMAVLEMGMSAFGELDYLANIARPDAAAITNIGMSHIENLGSQEGILKAKLEITNYFDKESVLFVNGDDKFLKEVKKDFDIVKYGTGENCNIRAEEIKGHGLLGTDFTLCMDNKRYPVYIKAPGVHNVYNAMAAIGIGMHFGIEPEEAIAAIGEVQLTDMRLTVEKIGDVTVIKDFYNAAPDSVRASLSVLKTAENARRVAVLGDILELGKFSESEHRKLGKSVYESADLLICAGREAAYIAEGARKAGMTEVVTFPDTESCAEEIKNLIKPGDVVIIKASRGMRFENIYQRIK